MLAPIYYSREDVAAVLSVSEATIEKLVRESKYPAVPSDFPKPRVLSAKRVGWLAREVVAWAEARPVSDLAPPPNTGAPKARKRQADADSRRAY